MLIGHRGCGNVMVMVRMAMDLDLRRRGMLERRGLDWSEATTPVFSRAYGGSRGMRVALLRPPRILMS